MIDYIFLWSTHIHHELIQKNRNNIWQSKFKFFPPLATPICVRHCRSLNHCFRNAEKRFSGRFFPVFFSCCSAATTTTANNKLLWLGRQLDQTQFLVSQPFIHISTKKMLIQFRHMVVACMSLDSTKIHTDCSTGSVSRMCSGYGLTGWMGYTGSRCVWSPARVGSNM